MSKLTNRRCELIFTKDLHVISRDTICLWFLINKATILSVNCFSLPDLIHRRTYRSDPYAFRKDLIRSVLLHILKIIAFYMNPILLRVCCLAFLSERCVDVHEIYFHRIFLLLPQIPTSILVTSPATTKSKQKICLTFLGQGCRVTAGWYAKWYFAPPKRRWIWKALLKLRLNGSLLSFLSQLSSWLAAAVVVAGAMN